MRPKRLKTFDYVGCYHYSLTFCAFRRNRYFEDSALVGLVQEQLSRTATEHQFEELAYASCRTICTCCLRGCEKMHR